MGTLRVAETGGAAVVVEGLVMRYGTTTAVDHLSMAIEQGTITAVLGPNGAGKTTTLETCEGYRVPQQGSVTVLGRDPKRDAHDLLPRIGVMLQQGGAWGAVRAVEMLEHMARLHAHPVDVDLLSERLDLAECGSTAYRRLSGGQQQRLGLAMALVGRPELVFVDEPTAGMDPHHRRATWGLLEELREDGVTVVLTTHYLDEAEQLADRIHIIDRGRLIASGTTEELTRTSGETMLRVSTRRRLTEAQCASLTEALGPGTSVAASDGGTVAVTGPAATTTVIAAARWCETYGIEPTSLVVGRRSLEDAFLELTGSRITAEGARSDD